MKKALILGLGVSGKSSWNYLKKKGYQVRGVDKNVREFAGETVFPETELSCLSDIDLVVKSPGIGFDHPLVKECKKREIPITSDIELGLLDLKEKNKTLFAITGSNGKTTTTLLTTHILNQCHKSALALGNVGNPLLDFVDAPDDFFCIELSSYQLENLSLPVFSGALILNVTPNHLERYSSFEDYARAKFQLQFCLKEEGKLYLNEKTKSQFSQLIEPKYKEKVATIFPLGYRDVGFSLMAHDWENASASYALCALAGVKEEEFWQAFKSFKKPPHRVEFVRLLNGVSYINDSKATSVDAVQKAVEGLSGEIILIAGGLWKTGSFQQWQESFKGKVRQALLIGQSAEKIEKEIAGFVPVEKCETLKCALKRAEEIAREGQSVLFSPGCQSFDQFTNYEHRGNVFKELVNSL